MSELYRQPKTSCSCLTPSCRASHPSMPPPSIDMCLFPSCSSLLLAPRSSLIPPTHPTPKTTVPEATRAGQPAACRGCQPLSSPSTPPELVLPTLHIPAPASYPGTPICLGASLGCRILTGPLPRLLNKTTGSTVLQSPPKSDLQHPSSPTPCATGRTYVYSSSLCSPISNAPSSTTLYYKANI